MNLVNSNPLEESNSIGKAVPLLPQNSIEVQPSIPINSRQKIATLASKLMEFKGDSNITPSHNYQRVSIPYDNFNSRIETFSKYISEFRNEISYFTLTADDIPEKFDLKDEIELLKELMIHFEKLNNQFPHDNIRVTESKTLGLATLNVFQTYTITLLSQLALYQNRFGKERIPFSTRLRDCFEFKFEIGKMIENIKTKLVSTNFNSELEEYRTNLEDTITTLETVKENCDLALMEHKQTATSRLEHKHTYTAAKKGRAAEGLETIRQFISSGLPLPGKAESVQDVYLVNQTTVFKNEMGIQNEIANYEESLARAGMAFFTKGEEVVEAFNINLKKGVQRFTFNQLNSEDLFLDPVSVPLKMLEVIESRIQSPFQKRMINELIECKMLIQESLFLQQKGQESIPISFREFAGIIANKTDSKDLHVSTLLSPDNLLDDPNFRQSLSTYVKFLKNPWVLRPIFQTPSEEAAYKACENCQWYDQNALRPYMTQTIVENSLSGIIETQEQIKAKALKRAPSIPWVNFQTVLERTMRTESLEERKKPRFTSGNATTDSLLSSAIGTQWKIIGLSLKKQVSKIDPATQQEINTIETIEKTQIKTFIKGMHLLNSLLLNKVILEKIIDKLSEESKYVAIETALFQFLDLHRNNLGFSPIANQAYDTWNDRTVSYSIRKPETNQVEEKKDFPFESLLLDFLEHGSLGVFDITFEHNNGEVNKTIKLNYSDPEAAELRSALNVEWQINLFDLDRILSESNLAVKYVDEPLKAPIRSHLLWTSFKDLPLPQKIIERLQNDLRTSHVKMMNWINKTSSPVMQVLNQYEEWVTNKQNFDEYLQDINITEAIRRSGQRQTSYNRLVNELATKLSNDFEPSFWQSKDQKTLWQNLEIILSAHLYPNGMTISLPEDTSLTQAASKYNTTLDILKKLNPNKEENLAKGMQIKIPFDLTSKTEQATERRKEIAKQMIPRMSIKQQRAFEERQEGVNNYLSKYMALRKCSTKKLRGKIISFLSSPNIPLTTARKQELLVLNQDLEQLRNDLLYECRPTYFNIIKAIYPLAADLEEIGEFAYGAHKMLAFESDTKFGIENTIASAKAQNNPIHAERIHLFEEKIRQIKAENTFAELPY